MHQGPVKVVTDQGAVSAGRLVPVTVVGGYLGAGKTTLVNRLLAAPHGRRLAVLVNDFGALDIDARLIAARGANTVSLSNGCVCCSIADALGDGLDEVLALHPRPDQIVIEASGAADPGKIAVYGQGWPGVRLDAVLTVVDATTMQANAADRFVGSLIVRQLAAADVILLSKIDLVDAETIDEARRWLATTVGSTPVVGLEQGQMDPALIIDLQAHTPGGIPVEPTDIAEFGSVVIEPTQPIERSALEAALRRWPDAVVRVKGFVRTTEPGDPLYEVHRVGRRWAVEPVSGVETPPGLVLVVIPAAAGNDGLDPNELERDLYRSPD